jgi:DNA replicative helicase MCM subunit Mcm2 (Cdc46/Mcm family)
VALALHVVTVHKTLRAPTRDGLMVVETDVMRAFIVKAQEFEPVIPQDLHNYIVAKYVEKRKLQREGLDEQSYMYVTPRTLLAIIRLSQALARLSFRNDVNQSDVDESIKLMDFSIRSLRTLKAENSAKDSRKNPATREFQRDDRMAKIMQAVRDAIQSSAHGYMKIVDIQKHIAKNLSTSFGKLDREELVACLNHY